MGEGLIQLYHGTKFKYIVQRILHEGFKPYTFFTTDLLSAIAYGDQYVFYVTFDKTEIPDNWQIRPSNIITPDRITQIAKFKITNIYYDRKATNKFRKINDKIEWDQPGYCYKDKLIWEKV